MIDFFWDIEIKGGPAVGDRPGSGHHGHRGRPGQQGGSLPGRGSSFSERVSSSEPMRVKFLGHGVAQAHVLDYEDGAKAIWKPTDNINYYHVSANEVVASVLDEALGLGVVPKTIFLDVAGDAGTAQEWIDNARSGKELRWSPDLIEENTELFMKNEDRITRMAIIDYLMANADRHSGNYLFDGDDKLWAIDHGHAFLLREGFTNDGWVVDQDTPYSFFDAYPSVPTDVMEALEASGWKDGHDDLIEKVLKVAPGMTLEQERGLRWRLEQLT